MSTGQTQAKGVAPAAPDVLSAGADRLQQAEAAYLAKRSGDEKVTAAQKALAPVVTQAKAAYKELRAFETQHGAQIKRLAGTDWRAVRDQSVHPLSLEHLERAVTSAHALLTTALAELPKIPERVKKLTLADVKAFEPERIAADARVYASVPETLRERLGRITHLLSEVQRQLGAKRGAPSEVVYITRSRTSRRQGATKPSRSFRSSGRRASRAGA